MNKTKLLIFTVIFITVLSVFFNSCKKDDDDDAPAENTTINGEEFTATKTSSQKNTDGGFTLQLSQNNTTIIISTNGTEAGKYEIVSKKKTAKEGKTATASINQNGTVTNASSGTVNITANGDSKISGDYEFTAGTINVSGGKFNDVAVAEGGAAVATKLELVSGDKQTATVGSELSSPIVVKVTDQNGSAFKDAKVTVTVTEGSVLGGGTTTDVTTDVDGQASVRWTLGTTVGEQKLTVKAFKADGTSPLTGSSFEVKATGDAATVITVTDIDGNTYKAVTIGTQVWMAENLKVTKYPNGDAIPLVEDNTAWGNLADDNSSDAYCYYNNNVNNEADTYGALYTYAAAIGDNWTKDKKDNQGICPDGWHLPSDAEWTKLTDYLGGTEIAGGKMKEKGTSHWKTPNIGATNESGFTALPGGYRFINNGYFDYQSVVSIFWSATEVDAASVLYRSINHYYSKVYLFSKTNKSFGLSVRCLQD